jgi:polyhydroxybutyrate depolymerase
VGVIFAAIALLAFPQAASSGARAVIGTYTLYRPASLSRSQQVPIVLSCCGSPTAQTRSIMDGLADRFGFVVVFLAPTRTYNDAAHARGPGPPLPDSVWAGQVIDEVLASQNGNPARVYSTGVSAGGTFSYRLACDMPNKIAAIGSVAGLDVVPGCRPARPIAVIEIHGLLDTAIPFNGRNPGSITIPDVIAKWRAIDQCSATSTVTTSGALKEQVWSQCAGTTAVELATVSNAGHGWPMSVDTGGILWRFLNAHPLASAQSATTAKVLRASIAYRPTRHVVLRLDLGQASKLKLSLARGTRKVAARTIAQAKAGAGTYTLAIPRKTKRGTLKLRVVVQASGSQVTLTRKLRLVR